MARLSNSALLALLDAQSACAQEASLDARQVAKLVEIIAVLRGMVSARSNHIGLINDLLKDLVESGDIDLLPSHKVSAVGQLLFMGNVLAIDDSGLVG